MSTHAYERIRTGQSTAGLIEVPQSIPIGQAIEDILTIVVYSTALPTSIAIFQGQPTSPLRVVYNVRLCLRDHHLAAIDVVCLPGNIIGVG